MSGAAYQVTGPSGKVFELTADAQGQAVSPALEPGAYRVETQLSPEGFGPAGAVQIEGLAGVPAVVDMLHKPLGKLEIKLQTLALSSQGEAQAMPQTGASMALLRLAEGAKEDDLEAYQAYPSEREPLMLTTDAQGVARDAAGALPALPAGIYRAFAADFSDPVHVNDGEVPTLEWTARAEQGGVRVTLRDAEDIQRPIIGAAFALAPLAPDAPIALSDYDDLLTVDEEGVALRVQLPQGRYRLWQTHFPDGYDPAPEQEIEIFGGELTEISLFNGRPGTLTVSKMGFTFNAEMQPFRVPLRGAYGLYVLRDKTYEPYPCPETQWVIAAHGMQMEGAMEAAGLPADINGTVYYLRELESAVSPGYVADAEFHEALMYPGRHTVAEIASVADRGFFVLTHRSAHDGAILKGAEYALHALASDHGEEIIWEEEPVLAFTLTGESYQNEMALPVGMYLMKMLRAPAGYMLEWEDIESVVEIPPYVRRGNPMAQIEKRSMPVPVADGSSPGNMRFPGRNRVRTLWLDPPDVPADIVAVELPRGHEDVPSTVEVVYRLALGGWNWTDIRLVTGLELDTQLLDLSDVDGRITAVQIRYLDTQVGDFSWVISPGLSTDMLRLKIAREPEAECVIVGEYAYTQRYPDERGEGRTIRVTRPIADFELDEPIWAEGRAVRQDGAGEGIGVIAGVIRRAEDVAAVPVLLERIDEAEGATIITETTPDAQGLFRFDGVPYDTYRLRFMPGEGQLVDAMTTGHGMPTGERVERGEGLTEVFVLDASERWHWVEAEMDRSAVVRGMFLLDGDQTGIPDVAVSLWRGEKQEAFALTDAQGRYVLTGMPDGDYTFRVALPEGRIFAGAAQASVQRLSLLLGETEMPAVAVTLPASLAGSLLADRGARGVSAAKVELMREGSEMPVDTVRTDNQGSFAFDGLIPATYWLRFSLPAAYAFPHEAAADPVQYTLAMGEVRNDVLVEAVRPGKLLVSAWEDGDYSGIRTDKAGGVAGVRMALAPMKDADIENLDWRTTGPDGIVLFERLEPGVYELWYDLPDPWRLTRRLDDQGREVPMQPGASGRGQTITLGDGQEAETGIGLVLPASVRGAVWQDADDNGLWDAGEAPFEGVEVNLVDPSGGMESRTAVTGEGGVFAFGEVPPGAYLLVFVAPEGWVIAAGADSSKPVQLGLGQALEGENMGMVRTGQVGGLMWEDANDNGEMDPIEVGLSGATIKLYRLVGTRGQRTLVAELSPGADGIFVFAGLRPGAYQLDCALPEGYVMQRAVPSTLRFEAGKAPHPLRSVVFTLSMGEEREGIHLAALRLGSLAGSVWEDKDYDGQRGPNEAGLPRATVALWREGHPEPLAVTETVRSGAYRFDALPPGDYTVRITLPEGYLFTRTSPQSLPDEGGREAVLPVALAMGEAIQGLDAGALMPASLGGLVWIDTNNDGMLDANEPPIPGVTLELFGADDLEQVVATVRSDERGRWRFENVMPGVYVIKPTLPEGYLFAAEPRWRSAARAGKMHSVDGPVAVSEAMELSAGQRIEQFNFGGIPAALIDGQVWLDGDNDGRRSTDDPALSGAKVTLLAGGEPVAMTETGENGAYRFEGLRPGVYALRFVLPDGHLFVRGEDGGSLVHGIDIPVGESASFSLAMGQRLTGQNVGALTGAKIQGAIWLDADEDGLWGNEEKGFAGALVELLEAASGEVLASMQTLDNGAYLFDQLRPGAYQVRIDLPEGDLFAPQARDKLVLRDARLGISPTLRLAMGEEADMGHVAAIHGASVSGVAWEDADVNGRFDPGEPPLRGTTAVLLRQEDGDWKSVGAQPVDEGGAYRFDSLRPGTYAVSFTLPSGYLFTDYLPDEQGPYSKVPLVDGQVGQTEPFQLTMGQIRPNLHVGGIRPGLVGDYAWIDENGNGLQDFGEPPLMGVHVALLSVMADGTVVEVASTTTDEYGLYRFTGLRPGLYRVRATLPLGFAFTVNRPDIPEVASAIPEGTGPSGESEDFVLRSGQSRRNIDIGARRTSLELE
ncbi:MAG: hypothetical protein FWD25_07305 [Clostridia bacterium]|nr:hypothetical protein [Clostridia bacterium]